MKEGDSSNILVDKFPVNEYTRNDVLNKNSPEVYRQFAVVWGPTRMNMAEEDDICPHMAGILNKGVS